MKLIMIWSVGDGYTYSYDIFKFFEYESEEALLCDFMDLVRKTRANYDKYEEERKRRYQAWQSSGESWSVEWATSPCSSTFQFCGEDFNFDDFFGRDDGAEIPPHVECLDTYFERVKLKSPKKC